MSKRNPNLGYIINAVKKRKLNSKFSGTKRQADQIKEVPSKKATLEADDDLASDDTNILSEQESENYTEVSNATMDTADINSTDNITIGNSTGGNMDDNSRQARSTSGAGGGLSSSSGGGLRGQAILSTGIRQNSMPTLRTYRKQYLLRLQNDVIETGHKYIEVFTATNQNTVGKVNNNNSGSFGIIRYPYHDLPVGLLGFYLTQEEIHSLQYFSECRVKYAKCDVYNKTGVLNFETASSLSSIGNNNVGIYLNKISADVGAKRSGQLPNQNILLHEVFQGEQTSTVSRENKLFSSTGLAKLGARYVRRTLNNKFEYYTPMNQSMDYNLLSDTWIGNNTNTRCNVPGIVPYFNLNPFIELRINASMNEGLFTTWNYSPSDGLIQGYFSIGPATIWQTYNKTNHRKNIPLIYSGTTNDLDDTTNTGYQYGRALTNSEGQSVEMNSENNQNSLSLRPWNRSPYLTQSIERTELNGKHIPPLILGIEPLVSEIPTSTNNKWEPVKCYVDLYVNVELTIECKYGYDYVDPAMPSIPVNYKFPQYTLNNNGFNMPLNTEKFDLITDNILTDWSTYDPLQNIPVFPNRVNPLMEYDKTYDSDTSRMITRSQSKKLSANISEDNLKSIDAVATRANQIASANERTIKTIVDALKTQHPSNQHIRKL